MQNDHGSKSDNTDKAFIAESGMSIFELCVTCILGLVITAAFITALTYDFVSAKAPLVILVPLMILIAIQIKRSLSASKGIKIGYYLAQVGKGKSADFNASAGFFGWMGLLLLLIFITGHYAGIAIFMFIMMYMVSNENLKLSVSVSGGITIVIYFMFEHVFNIELYRGMIFRIWAGYGVF